MTLVTAAFAFLKSNWPLIAAATPTVVVGLNRIDYKPPWLRRTLQFLSAFSFAAHRDEPDASLQLPVYSAVKRALAKPADLTKQ